MKGRLSLAAGIAVLAIIVPLSVSAGGDKGNRPDLKEEGSIHLSKDLKKVLNEEMAALQKGMTELVPALASGDWEGMEKIAVRMEESYILKRKLTKEQVEELHGALPQGFKELDHEFHSTAGRLAHAAAGHDGELVSFYFYKLNESCVKCHSTYAGTRFPGFGKKAGDGGHKH